MSPPTTSLLLDPILPLPLVILLGAIFLTLTVWAYWRIGAAIERWRNILLMIFRITGIALVVLLLLQPSRQEILAPPTKERVTLVAVDTSLSMKQRDVERATRLDAAKNLLSESEIV